jgi:hypothetical protein
MVAAMLSAQACGNSGIESLSVDLAFFGKVLTFPTTYFGMLAALRNADTESIDAVARRVARILLYALTVALALASFGYGAVNYGRTEGGEAFGYRGYFIAGNELSGLFTLVYALALALELESGEGARRRALFAGTAGFAAAVLIFTKVALLGYLAGTSAVLLFARWHQQRSSARNRTWLGRMAGCALVVAASSYLLQSDRVAANAERLTDNIGRAGDWLTFLLSGRLESIEVSWNMYSEGYSSAAKVFGCGWHWPEYLHVAAFGGTGSAEVDHLDLLVAVGIVGTTMTYLVWAIALRQVFLAARARRGVVTSTVLYVLVLLVALGSLSGHIMYSALVGFYMALASALAVLSHQGRVNAGERKNASPS